ncbi:Armadillo-type fold protein [Metarhizium rileyi]|uniref:Armadillo-type fold protein n=1 Tax=Metarhizium rileyi (strain RCEF 4871) TaxID=1649241 RepID=A0A167KHF8_METRR|nr:Armadillo-type fold protein [Metarhizium rileyi RCEF 4871]
MASVSCGQSPISAEDDSQSRPASFLVSFLHRRQPSSGKTLPTFPPAEEQLGSADDAMAGQFVGNNPGALGELQQNRLEAAPRSPRKSRDEPRTGAQSPTKSALGKFTFRSNVDREPGRMAASRDASPQKPKKARSGANLAGLLSRPKSLKSLYKLATEEESRAKDKENVTPDRTPSDERPPPIFAQFTSDRTMRQESTPEKTPIRAPKDRPKSFHALKPPQSHVAPSCSPSKPNGRAARPVSMHPDQMPRRKGPFGHGRSKSTAVTSTGPCPELHVDPKDIDEQLEALLDRRNIPENQRYKMRNLADTIKLEFIRQDYAEMQAARGDRPGSTGTAGSNSSSEQAIIASDLNSPDGDDGRPKRGRGKSFTFSRSKKDSSSPAKKSKGEGTLGRHFRGRSTDSVVSDARPGSSSSSSMGSAFLSKIKAQQGPSDYVAYLRKVQKPEMVEVGKLHKLRLLLRNETVAWIEDFIQQGGMHEIVGLLNRIMEVEWREEHEDALLHENLLCLKGLATTARAMEYLNAVQADLLPRLLHMLFDPERKGPSEFTTRNIVTSVLLRYIESAPPAERVVRAKNVLSHLRDKDPAEGERPLPFVMDMRRQRPYRVWCKEVVSVTKEVFWIFLHNLNVVALASDETTRTRRGCVEDSEDRDGPFAYMLRNFPQERPPVPAAPYVGGVEWDATNYLASHLDLMNAIIACTPTAHGRNLLRAEFRISGWERCLGGSLRICKEKFYGSVHVALRTWVAAAAEDGWDVKDVRFGPPPESRSPRKTGGQRTKPEEAPPRLDMPRLDFGDRQPGRDAWL